MQCEAAAFVAEAMQPAAVVPGTPAWATEEMGRAITSKAPSHACNASRY
jgi:hypothetical protein